MKTITITDRTEIETLIVRCPYCIVALIDTEGRPYAIPMNFAYRADEGPHGTLYLHSGPHGSKVEMLRRCPEVCVNFVEGHELVAMHREVACSYSMKSTSVVACGTACPVEDDDEKHRALMQMMQQYGATDCRPIAEPAIRNVLLWKVPFRTLTCKRFGLRPSEI